MKQKNYEKRKTKRHSFARFGVLLLLSCLCSVVFASCGANTTTVTVRAIRESVEIEETRVAGYSYAAYFRVTADGNDLSVTSEMIDASDVRAAVGTYTVRCTYLDKTASLSVTVTEAAKPTPKDTVRAVSPSVTIAADELKTYDFSALFLVSNGETELPMPEGALDASAVREEPGTYAVICRVGDTVAAVNVIVTAAGEPAPDAIVTVDTKNNVIDLKDEDVAGYDYTKLFVVRSDGKSIPVNPSWIDASKVLAKAGNYSVSCTYRGKTANVIVRVSETVYTLTAKQTEVTLSRTAVAGYDFLSLFTATRDGAPLPIPADALTHDVSEEAGDYTCTVTLGGLSASVTVHVLGSHVIEAIPAYTTYTLRESDLASLDPCDLFSLYVDGSAVRVTADMIDASALASATAGNRYSVTLSYTLDDSVATASVDVAVSEAGEVLVTARNLTMFPNEELPDLTALFTVTEDGMPVKVTGDMLSGTVDCSAVGEYPVTLSYRGKTAVATVKVTRGAMILFPHGQDIDVTVGTDKNTYAFLSDFEVLINGTVFHDLPASVLNLSNADFTKEGDCEVTLTVKFNDEAIGGGLRPKINFKEISGTVTYHVSSPKPEITVRETRVELPFGTAFNPASYLSVRYNGIPYVLTDREEYAGDPATCYYKWLTGPIDGSVPGEQTARLALYIGGLSTVPTEVTFDVYVDSGVTAEAEDRVVFTGDTLYMTELFTVTENGVPVKVTKDMVQGKADLFVPGQYKVTLTYGGITRVSTVTVLDRAMLGTYETELRTIAAQSSSYDDEEGDWGFEPAAEATRLSAFVLYRDGSVSLPFGEGTVVAALNENTLRVSVKNNLYTLHYHDGIMEIDPDNTYKMAFTDSRRPLVYFHKDVYRLDGRFTVNAASDYVLNMNTVSASLDVFRLTRMDGETTSYYGMYVRLAERSSSDTVYQVSFGEVAFADGFTGSADEVSSLTYNGETFVFTVLSAGTAKTVRAEASDTKFAGKTFSGTVDGKPAVLSVSEAGGYTLTVNEETVLSVSLYELSQMSYGGAYDETNTVVLYDVAHRSDEPFYSYRFILDLDTLSFVLLEKDAYYGKYLTADRKVYLFLDGYGHGLINYNSSSFVRTQISYEVRGSDLYITHVGVLPGYQYGSGALFRLSPLHNVLTAVDVTGDALQVGDTLENDYIVDGAIITVGNTVFGAGAAKADLFAGITVRTKDGLLTGSALENAVDLSTVNFSTEGFYQFSVNVEVGGQPTATYYAVQILASSYKDSPFLGAYVATVAESAMLSFDKYGRVTLTYSDIEYKGLVYSADDTTLVAYLRDEKGQPARLLAERYANGILNVRCSGSLSLSDRYVNGVTECVGTDGYVLRSVKIANETYYFFSGNVNSAGEPATVTLMSGEDITAAGSVFEVENASGEKVYFRVLEWGNVKNGLLLTVPN